MRSPARGLELGIGLAISGVALVAAMGILSVGPVGADSNPTISPVIFDTCGMKTWTVPAGVTSATFVVSGAAGGNGVVGINAQAVGGFGGRATGALAVTPGETLTVIVGCARMTRWSWNFVVAS